MIKEMQNGSLMMRSSKSIKLAKNKKPTRFLKALKDKGLVTFKLWQVK